MTKRSQFSGIEFDESDEFSSDEEQLKSFKKCLKGKKSRKEISCESSAEDDDDDESLSSDEICSEAVKATKIKKKRAIMNINKLKQKLSSIPSEAKDLSSSDEASDLESGEEISSEVDSMEPQAHDKTEGQPKFSKKNSSGQIKAGQKVEVDQEERQMIRAELKKMSVEEIQKLKESLGLKLYNQALGISEKKKPKSMSRETFRRDNKNRPREMSSKRQVARLRDVVGVSSETNEAADKRDPRFDSLCGNYEEKVFKESYKFVFDIKAKEREKLKAELENETDEKRAKEIKYLIQRYDNQERERKKLDARNQIKSEEYTKNKLLAQEGKKPKYLPKSELKKRELVLQYEDLKKEGNVDKYLKKKNKKILSKERKAFIN